MAGPIEMFREFLDTELFGGPMKVGSLILFVLLLVAGALVADLLSRIISRFFLRTFRRKGDDAESRRLRYLGRHALMRYIHWTIFITFLLLSTNVLGVNMEAEFPFIDISPAQFINLMVFIFAIVLFVQVALSPLVRFFVHIYLEGRVERREELRLYRLVLTPLRLLLILLGIAEALSVVFGPGLPHAWLIIPIIIFVGLLLAAALMAAIIILYLRREQIYLEPRTKYAPSPVEKIVKYIAYLFGITVALIVLGVDIVAVAASLGLIGFALAFGLQDTIANLAAGIMIAVDRPFAIGDRIKIGDRWGDVVDIGLRSTRVATPEGEVVILPNHLVATQEVWNYTLDVSRIRDSLTVQVSYGSDLDLVEKVLLEIARGHPLVMTSPSPFVWFEAFADSGITVNLQYWILDARDREQIRSDLIRDIKKGFDSSGIEIPFPYRTVVYKNDLPPESTIGDEGYTSVKDLASIGQIVLPPGTSMPPREGGGPLLIPMGLVPFSRLDLQIVFDLAKALDKDLVFLYIRGPKTKPGKGTEMLADILAKSEEVGVRAEGKEQRGSMHSVIEQAAREHSPSGVVITFPLELIRKMTREDLWDLAHELRLPVIILRPLVIR
ncbi:MAG TPA: mechanosensitive ion channel family protein [Thermoplasmata archaeon]|nr:mechanosensitive ion channel family protein [Thermoplasmata archaeon]